MQPRRSTSTFTALAAARLRSSSSRLPLHAPTGMVAVEAGMAAGGTAVAGVGRGPGWGWRGAGWGSRTWVGLAWTSMGRGGHWGDALLRPATGLLRPATL